MLENDTLPQPRQGCGGRLRKAPAFVRDTCGAVAIIAAIVFPIVLGGIGLGVETSYWYMTQRRLQHVADVAAHAAAARLRAADTYDRILTAATHIATSSGFQAGQGTLTLNIPPTSGPSAGAANTVEVVLTENWSRWFSAIFDPDPVTLSARTVTALETGATGCVLALSPTANGAITIAGSTSVALHNCDVASNSVSASSFLMSGTGSAITTGCIYTVGQAVSNSGLTLTRCPQINMNAPRVRDPYANVAEPAILGPCENDKIGQPNKVTRVTPTYNHPSGMKSMRFCGGLDLKGAVQFDPGLYLIENGPVRINGGDTTIGDAAGISGTGVTFFLAPTAALDLRGNVTLGFRPPTSGPFSGIVFFGARNATAAQHLINGTAGSTLQGAIYFPASQITFKGNSETVDGCTQVIGRTVTLSGNSTLRSSCATSGTRPLTANENVAFLE